MKLHTPFAISARLMPALQVGGAWISLNLSGNQSRDGRDIYEAWIDLPDGTEHEVTDLRSGCQGGTVQEGFESLLCFLGAAAESYRYAGGGGENVDLFPLPVVKWAAQHSDEIEMLQVEIEESPGLIED
jgi:hypothetical protein